MRRFQPFAGARDSGASTHSGRWRFSDNIFVERLWHSLKYEEIYLKAYQTIAEANGIACYFHFYIHELYTGPWVTAPRARFSGKRYGLQAPAREKNRWCRS
jgi:hypothetical protein